MGLNLILNQGQDQDLMIEIGEEITILLHEIITDVERIVRTNDARTSRRRRASRSISRSATSMVRHLNVHHLEVRHLNVHRQRKTSSRRVHTNDARTTFNLKLDLNPPPDIFSDMKRRRNHKIRTLLDKRHVRL